MLKVTLGPLMSCSRVVRGRSGQNVWLLTLIQASSCAVLAGASADVIATGASDGLIVEDLLVRTLHSLREQVSFGEDR